jgi:hypothetical protein
VFQRVCRAPPAGVRRSCSCHGGHGSCREVHLELVVASHLELAVTPHLETRPSSAVDGAEGGLPEAMVATPARALMDPPTERLPRRCFSRATAPLRPPTKLLPSLLETASPHRPLPKRGEDLHGHHTRLHRHGCENGGAPQPCAQGRIACATRPWMHHGPRR